MSDLRSVVLIASAACLPGFLQGEPEICAVRKAPNQVFVPPPPYEASPGEGTFYFGSIDFWTILPSNGLSAPQYDQSTYEMLNSIDFPTTGCWEISARYHRHELKFVVWVIPFTTSSN
jgi:hypothetical protein